MKALAIGLLLGWLSLGFALVEDSETETESGTVVSRDEYGHGSHSEATWAGDFNKLRLAAQNEPDKYPYYMYPNLFPHWVGPNGERSFICCWKFGVAPRLHIGRCMPTYIEIMAVRCGAPHHEKPLHLRKATPSPTPSPDIRFLREKSSTKATAKPKRKNAPRGEEVCLSKVAGKSTQDCEADVDCKSKGCGLARIGTKAQNLTKKADFSTVAKVNEELKKNRLLYSGSGKFKARMPEKIYAASGSIFWGKKDNHKNNILNQQACGVLYRATDVEVLSVSPKEHNPHAFYSELFKGAEISLEEVKDVLMQNGTAANKEIVEKALATGLSCDNPKRPWKTMPLDLRFHLKGCSEVSKAGTHVCHTSCDADPFKNLETDVMLNAVNGPLVSSPNEVLFIPGQKTEVLACASMNTYYGCSFPPECNFAPILRYNGEKKEFEDCSSTETERWANVDYGYTHQGWAKCEALPKL